MRRHRQARRYTLRIHAVSREVVLTMPPRGSVKHARDFAERHGAWIAARLRRLPGAAPFVHGAVLPLRGVCTGSSIAPVRAAPSGSRRRAASSLLCVAGEAPHVPRRVRDYLKREAKRDLEAASSARSAIARRHVQARCRCATRRSRWGSCSSTGVLSIHGG